MSESERSPWSKSPQEVLHWLEVDAETGLDSKTVNVRRERYGLNVLQERPRRSLLSIFFAQFRSLLVALLAAALAAAIFYQEWVEASAIGSVLLVNALIGFLTELRAVRSMEALRTLGKTEARVLRDGRAQAVDAEMLVPGDIVLLEGGDVVSADARLLSASKLQTNESALTGESEPVEKRIDAVAEESPIAERTSQLYRGTVVTRGSATAVVTATGVDSELGQISQLVAETQGESTPLEKRLNRLGRGLVWATLFVAAMVLVLGVLAGEPMFLLVETAIALAVAAVPEGLPILATIALARGMGRMAKQNALVNRLSAVETLGATQILCTDKTGTLTENEMRVVSLEVAPAPDAEQHALEVAVLCNNASLDGAGDPTEVALLEFAATRNVLRDDLAAESPEQHEVAFDSDVMMMATLNGSHFPYRICVKGAPEPVLAACNLESSAREEWARKSAELADQGLRVLALAEGASATLTDDVYRELDFLGLVAMHDPLELLDGPLDLGPRRV
ncbi:MAG: HAD-IC family P-type ATPase, partial [Myxococcota bacterium]